MADASERKSISEWNKGLIVIGLSTILGGGSAFGVGNITIGKIETKLDQYQIISAMLSERMVRLETKMDMFSESGIEDKVQKHIRQLVKSEALK